MKLFRDALGSAPSGSLGGDRRHQVYCALKARALLYKFRPGQHLPVVEFSDQLKVSSTPVREALIRLHAEGHIAAIPARGFFARELSLREMLEIHHLLHVLLRYCLQAADVDPMRTKPLPDPGPVPSIPCDPRTALALARRTEAIFLGMARWTKSDLLHRTVGDLCERSHHIRRCAYRTVDLTVPLYKSLAALAQAVSSRDGVVAVAALDGYFGVLETALPGLVGRALATSFTQDCV